MRGVDDKMLIYKITNKINNKCYIGQTIKSAEERWKEHKAHAFGSHENDQNKTLYKAIRKYGLENFTFEVLQDNIETHEQLDKAEIYWIDFYNSFLKGYNETSGGQQYHKRLPNKEIIEDYYKTKSARKTALNFGINHSTVDDILNHNNIKRFSQSDRLGQTIRIKKDNFIKEFDSVIDCAIWFTKQPFCRTKRPDSVRTSLKQARKENRTYYGYIIENIEE